MEAKQFLYLTSTESRRRVCPNKMHLSPLVACAAVRSKAAIMFFLMFYVPPIVCVDSVLIYVLV